jgi:hypothetical protein
MKHRRFSRKPKHKAIECWKMQYMLQNMTLVQQWKNGTPRMQSSASSTMEAEYITLSEIMREILSNS